MSDNWGIPDPTNVNLNDITLQQATCYLSQSGNEYNGNLGARISSIFVIGAISTFVTFFPVVAKRVPRLHIPLYVYLFARYFGAGVIVATAFIHLLDPAYAEIGPNTCVGMTGGWAQYSWPPAIVLVSVVIIFLMDLGADIYVQKKYGIDNHDNVEQTVTGRAHGAVHEHQDGDVPRAEETRRESLARYEKQLMEETQDATSIDEHARRQLVQQQIAGFLILEFGVIFHSVFIGLNLGVCGDEFSTLYVVLIFHQSFEGLGIGARLSAIPFAKGSWIPWALCSAYGLTTPIAIAIGLGLRTTYNSGSFTANIVNGVFDSISAGILIYTGLVELLARDFIFNPERTRNSKQLSFMLVCVVLGAGLMALLGKWA
jgi:solute carrier family 39 (zinc transporter), member 1/2/3